MPLKWWVGKGNRLPSRHLLRLRRSHARDFRCLGRRRVPPVGQVGRSVRAGRPAFQRKIGNVRQALPPSSAERSATPTSAGERPRAPTSAEHPKHRSLVLVGTHGEGSRAERRGWGCARCAGSLACGSTPRRPLQVDEPPATIIVAGALLASQYHFGLVVQIGGSGLAADRSPGSW